MHRNSYINAPKLLTPTLQLKKDSRIMFAGQLCGVEGYTESAATGLVAGKRLQSSKDRGQTFTCTLGQNLIEGWSEGMVGMKEGGTRRLFVPWKLGYGERGMGSMIPAKADLVFEIDFVKAL
jgi:folate-dependent tRNA-U54 methylase TrmFO/GidA